MITESGQRLAGTDRRPTSRTSGSQPWRGGAELNVSYSYMYKKLSNAEKKRANHAFSCSSVEWPFVIIQRHLVRSYWHSRSERRLQWQSHREHWKSLFL